MTILLFPVNTNSSVGDAILFTCTAAGIPPPEITWLKDGLPLMNDLSNVTESRLSNNSGHFTVSVLTLCDLELSDSSEYSCIASHNISSGIETDVRSFTLEVQGKIILN